MIFFPSFISLCIIKNRENKNYKDLLFLYPIYNVFVNIISLVILFLAENRRIIYLSDNSNRIDFCFKYLILSSIVALIIPFVKDFLIKNIKLEIEAIVRKRKNEKKK